MTKDKRPLVVSLCEGLTARLTAGGIQLEWKTRRRVHGIEVEGVICEEITRPFLSGWQEVLLSGGSCANGAGRLVLEKNGSAARLVFLGSFLAPSSGDVVELPAQGERQLADLIRRIVNP